MSGPTRGVRRKIPTCDDGTWGTLGEEEECGGGVRRRSGPTRGVRRKIPTCDGGTWGTRGEEGECGGGVPRATAAHGAPGEELRTTGKLVRRGLGTRRNRIGRRRLVAAIFLRAQFALTLEPSRSVKPSRARAQS